MTTTDTAAQPATVFDETQVQLSRVYSDALLAAAQKGGALEEVVTDSDRLLGRCRVRVVSVRELTSEQSQTLSRQLQERLGLMPVLVHSVDPSLIGGLVIRVGDLQFDSSIRSRLEQLRKNLLEGKIHEIQSRRDQLHTSA